MDSFGVDGMAQHRELQALNQTVIPDGEVNLAIVLIYGIQLANDLLVLSVYDKFPRLLAVYFVACVAAGYPVSYFTNNNVYEFFVGDLKWRASLLKVFLVIIFAGLPALWFYGSKLKTSKRFGRYITVVLALNILYTLILDLSINDTCGYLRSVMVVIMCISLFLRLAILELNGQPVIYKTTPEPYSTVLYCPVSTLWVGAYILWNSFFSLAEFGPRTMLQIILLLIGMGYEFLKYSIQVHDFRVFFLGYKLTKTYVDLTRERAKHDTPDAPPLGWFFGFARALTLSGYFAVNPLIGMIPVVQQTKVSFPLVCDTEVAFYNGFVLVLFVVDLFWATVEYMRTRKLSSQNVDQGKATEAMI